MRRATFSDEPVDYAAVGATQSNELMRYPPIGFQPFQTAVRLGSGTERFELATAQVMTWQVQAGAGFVIDDVHEGTGVQYTGVVFDDDGTPTSTVLSPNEHRFSPAGDPFITAGMTAKLTYRFGPFRIASPVRVVYVIEEPKRHGFACGTLPGHPQSGEMSFVVEHRDDNTVWLVLRAFSRPGNWFYRLFSPALKAQQKRIFTKFQRSLLPGRVR